MMSEVKPKISKKEQISSIIKTKTKDKFLSQGQKDYYNKLTNSQITICSGPAGVGGRGAGGPGAAPCRALNRAFKIRGF